MSLKSLPGLCAAWVIFWLGLAASLASAFCGGTPARRIAAAVGSKPAKSPPCLNTFGRLGRRTLGGAFVAPSRASPIA
eukprot:2999788-Pyramimonas_sp.AAC.1